MSPRLLDHWSTCLTQEHIALLFQDSSSHTSKACKMWKSPPWPGQSRLAQHRRLAAAPASPKTWRQAWSESACNPLPQPQRPAQCLCSLMWAQQGWSLLQRHRISRVVPNIALAQRYLQPWCWHGAASLHHVCMHCHAVSIVQLGRCTQ